MTDLFSAPAVRAPATPPAAPAGHFTHPCETCGGLGLFGFGVRLLLDQRGRWYCGEHRPGQSQAIPKESAS